MFKSNFSIYNFLSHLSFVCYTCFCLIFSIANYLNDSQLYCLSFFFACSCLILSFYSNKYFDKCYVKKRSAKYPLHRKKK